MSETVRRRFVVHGRVQGVFFRDSARSKAGALGVTGWISNRSDGAVEAVFDGAPDAVAAMVVWSRQGPRGADVDRLEESEERPEGRTRFEVR